MEQEIVEAEANGKPCVWDSVLMWLAIAGTKSSSAGLPVTNMTSAELGARAPAYIAREIREIRVHQYLLGLKQEGPTGNNSAFLPFCRELCDATLMMGRGFALTEERDAKREREAARKKTFADWYPNQETALLVFNVASADDTPKIYSEIANKPKNVTISSLLTPLMKKVCKLLGVPESNQLPPFLVRCFDRLEFHTGTSAHNLGTTLGFFIWIPLGYSSRHQEELAKQRNLVQDMDQLNEGNYVTTASKRHSVRKFHPILISDWTMVVTQLKAGMVGIAMACGIAHEYVKELQRAIAKFEENSGALEIAFN